MKINVNVRKVENEKLKGVATVYLGDAFQIRNVKIIEGEKGLFIAMPNYKTKDEEYKDIIFPVTAEVRKKLDEAILKEYENPTSKENYKKEPEDLKFEVKAVALEGDSSVKGLASLKIEDSIVVNNIRLIEGQKGVFVAMPDYKTKDEKYNNLFSIIDDRTKDKINNEILEKYQISRDKLNEKEKAQGEEQEEDLEV